MIDLQKAADEVFTYMKEIMDLGPADVMVICSKIASSVIIMKTNEDVFRTLAAKVFTEHFNANIEDGLVSVKALEVKSSN